MWFRRAVSIPPKRNLVRLPLPTLLTELIESGRWRQPSDEKMLAVIPFLIEPVKFLRFNNSREFEAQLDLADDPHLSEIFREYRGSRENKRDLPWLDVEKAVFIVYNREPGADLAVALDYRTSMEDPRVVASDWWSVDSTHKWRLVEEKFSDFITKLEL